MEIELFLSRFFSPTQDLLRLPGGEGNRKSKCFAMMASSWATSCWHASFSLQVRGVSVVLMFDWRRVLFWVLVQVWWIWVFCFFVVVVRFNETVMISVQSCVGKY